MKRLVLIDGKSVFYRGYYAMGALSLQDGTPTGGVYGFAAIAMEIVKKLNPTKVIVAWDSKSSTSNAVLSIKITKPVASNPAKIFTLRFLCSKRLSTILAGISLNYQIMKLMILSVL